VFIDFVICVFKCILISFLLFTIRREPSLQKSVVQLSLIGAFLTACSDMGVGAATSNAAV